MSLDEAYLDLTNYIQRRRDYDVCSRTFSKDVYLMFYDLKRLKTIFPVFIDK